MNYKLTRRAHSADRNQTCNKGTLTGFPWKQNQGLNRNVKTLKSGPT